MAVTQLYRLGSDGNWHSPGRPDIAPGAWTPGVVEPSLANIGTSAANCGARIARSSMTVVSANPFTPVDGTDYTNTVFTGKVTTAANTGGTFTDCFFAGANPTTSEGGTVDLRAGDGSSGKLWTFTNCTFQPDSPNAWTDNIIGHHFKLIRCLLRDGNDGVGGYNTNGPDLMVYLWGCYIDRVGWYYPDPTGVHSDGTHSDVIQIQSGNILEVIGCSLHGYIVDRTGNAATNNPSGSNSGPFPYLQAGQILQVQKASTITWAPSQVKVQNNWAYGSFNGYHYTQVTDDIIHTGNKTMDNGLTKDGSHSNHVRVTAGESINGQTFATGYYDQPAGWNNTWGFTGVDAFGAAVTSGQTVKIRVD